MEQVTFIFCKEKTNKNVSMFFLYKIVSRLVPVAIVVFRYLMVCKAVWCQNLGGERFLWRIVSHQILLLIAQLN